MQHGRTWLSPLFLQTSTPQTAAPVPVVYIHTIKATAAPKQRRAYPPDSTTTTPRAPQRDTHLYCIHPLHRRLVMYRGLHVKKNENLGVSAGDVRAPAVRARRGAAAGQDRIRGQKGMQKTWRRWRGCSPSLRALGFGFWVALGQTWINAGRCLQVRACAADRGSIEGRRSRSKEGGSGEVRPGTPQGHGKHVAVV